MALCCGKCRASAQICFLPLQEQQNTHISPIEGRYYFDYCSHQPKNGLNIHDNHITISLFVIFILCPIYGIDQLLLKIHSIVEHSL